jgi:hypothetical protein
VFNGRKRASAQACKGAENVLGDAISVTARLQAQV